MVKFWTENATAFVDSIDQYRPGRFVAINEYGVFFFPFSIHGRYPTIIRLKNEQRERFT